MNKYKPTGRIADYGGTDTIGAPIVKRMLTINEVGVKEGEPGKELNVIVFGSGEKKTPPEYLVLDYDSGVDLMQPIKAKKFSAGICMDLLEHVSNPFVVAENISNSLKSGAMLFVTVPLIWELHYYPKDYWRFTPQGLAELFPKMKKKSIKIFRDPSPEELVPRQRLIAILKKR